MSVNSRKYCLVNISVTHDTITPYIDGWVIKLFSLRLWCEQGFDYDITPILQVMFSLKLDCYISVYCF